MKYSENRDNNCLCHLLDRDSGNEKKKPVGPLNIVFLGKKKINFFLQNLQNYVFVRLSLI